MRTLWAATLATVLLAMSHTVAARSFDKEVAADPNGTVEVSNVSGKVEVTGWDQPRVSVHAELSGDVSDIEVNSERGRTTISVRFPRATFFGGGDAHLKIMIPRGSECDVSAVSADVSSSGVLGAQRLKSVSGSIVADIAQADVEAKSVSGDITLRGNGKPGALHATSISGTVRLDRGAGDIEANTVSGDLKVSLDPGRSVRMRTTSGDVAIQGRLAKDADLDAQTVSGDVSLRAAPEGGYSYEVATFSGSISNCFNATAERTSKYGPGERLSGTRGTGGAHVRIKTMSGDVELCDRP